MNLKEQKQKIEDVVTGKLKEIANGYDVTCNYNIDKDLVVVSMILTTELTKGQIEKIIYKIDYNVANSVVGMIAYSRLEIYDEEDTIINVLNTPVGVNSMFMAQLASIIGSAFVEQSAEE